MHSASKAVLKVIHKLALRQIRDLMTFRRYVGVESKEIIDNR